MSAAEDVITAAAEVVAGEVDRAVVDTLAEIIEGLQRLLAELRGEGF